MAARTAPSHRRTRPAQGGTCDGSAQEVLDPVLREAERAERPDRTGRRPDDGVGNGEFYRRAMAAELELGPDDELLDVGCGVGGLLAEHAAHVRYVAGLDASEIQIEMARRRLADRIVAGTAEVVLGDAADLPWEDDRFSVVASLEALKFMPDPEGTLREMHRREARGDRRRRGAPRHRRRSLRCRCRCRCRGPRRTRIEAPSP